MRESIDAHQAQKGTQIVLKARPTPEEAAEVWRERLARRKKAARKDSTHALAQIHLLEELAKGDPVTRKRASELTGLPLEEIDHLFSSIETAGGQLNDQGDFIGMILTLRPTRHKFRVNDNAMYARCSLDTILLPGLLESVGEVESTDPVTGETIRLTVTADQIVEVEPPGAVTSVFVPGKPSTETDDGVPVAGADSELCTSMLFYASRENAEKALENYPNIAIFTIEEAFKLARETSTEPTRALRRKVANG